MVLAHRAGTCRQVPVAFYFCLVGVGRTGAVSNLGRDLGSYVAKARTRIADQVALLLGYAVAYAGRFEFLERARERFASIVPAILAILAFLLFMAFQRTWSCWRPLCR
jgi:Cu/Ag efflux pump CusA